MNSHFKTVLATAALTLGSTLALSAHAAAYKCTDDNGKTVYSDIPCAKKAPPAVKPAAVPAAAPVAATAAAPISKITEADVLRTLTASQEYARSNNHAELCNLFSADMTFRTEYQGPKPKTVSGGHDQACKQASDAADLSKRTGLILQVERGETKVKIEPGELRAVAVYETNNRVTRYDRILDSYRCSSKDQFVLAGGKLLFVSSEEVCKP